MTKEEAMQHGLGYAAGREDGSNVRTVDLPEANDRMGWMRFAEAYAQGWEEFNTQQRFMMVNCRDAYNTWQASNGQTIFKEDLPKVAAHVECALCGPGTDHQTADCPY